LGGVQKNEIEEEMLDIRKREKSGGSKSHRPLEREALAIERTEKTAEDIRMADKNGQNWISMR
jgi:hypothetical protein